MKILITGGTGRIGANLAKRLLEKGHDIRSFVYPADASRARKLDEYNRVETVVGDLRDLKDVKRAVDGVDAIYHLAAAFMGPFDNLQYLHINAMGNAQHIGMHSVGLSEPPPIRLCLHGGDLLAFGRKGAFFRGANHRGHGEPLQTDAVLLDQMDWRGVEHELSHSVRRADDRFPFRDRD